MLYVCWEVCGETSGRRGRERERRGDGAKQCRIFSGNRKQRLRDGNELEKGKTERPIEGREMR